MKVFTETWALATQYGEKLVQGELSAAELNELQGKLSAKDYLNQDEKLQGDRKHNKTQAVMDFVTYTQNFMSEQVLFEVTKTCVRQELEKVIEPFELFRSPEPTLGKGYLAAMMKRHMKANNYFGLLSWVGMFVGQTDINTVIKLTEKQQNALLEILNAVTLPDTIAYLYKNLILPEAEKSKGLIAPKTIKNHVAFVCLQFVIQHELLKKYHDAKDANIVDVSLMHISTVDDSKWGNQILQQIDRAHEEPRLEATNNAGRVAALKQDLQQQITNISTRNHLERALLEATIQGDEVRVDALLKANINANATDQNGFTALHHASQKNTANMVELLVKSGKVDVNKRSNNSQTPLMLAVESGSTANVTALFLSKDLKLDERVNGITPLLRAAELNLPGVVRILVRHGADTAAKTKGSMGFLGSKSFTDLIKGNQHLQNIVDTAREELQKLALESQRGMEPSK